MEKDYRLVLVGNTQVGLIGLKVIALITNGRVKSKGTIPSKSMIKRWLGEEKG
jgi:hypothetical protein